MVHEVVDNGVVHGVRHGEPVHGQVHVLHVVRVHHARVVKHVEEVGMVRQPADGEQEHHGEQHAHHLRTDMRL